MMIIILLYMLINFLIFQKDFHKAIKGKLILHFASERDSVFHFHTIMPFQTCISNIKTLSKGTKHSDNPLEIINMHAPGHIS